MTHASINQLLNYLNNCVYQVWLAKSNEASEKANDNIDHTIATLISQLDMDEHQLEEFDNIRNAIASLVETGNIKYAFTASSKIKQLARHNKSRANQ